MKLLGRARLVLAALLFVGAGFARAELLDRIVATVDTEVILYSELRMEIQPVLDAMSRSGESGERFQRRAEKLVLDQAVESKILLREAQLLGIEATDEEIERHIESFRELYPSNTDFLNELAAAGETLSDFRVRIRKRLLAQKMAVGKLRALEREAIISEAEVAQYYEDNKAQFMRPERIRVRQIFLKCGSDPEERAKTRARLEVLREELEAGADFAELAKAYSEAPGAEDGGMIGWQQRGDLVEALDTAVFALPEDGISPVVESRGGLHLMKVDQREASGIASLDEVRMELEPRLRSAYAEERYGKWMGELRKRSRVRIFM